MSGGEKAAPALPASANVPATPVRRRQTSMLLDVERFTQAQRVARVLAMSPLFPEHLRGAGNAEIAIANGVLVLNIADRLDEDPLTVAQNIYFVGVKPGWSTSYMISRANMAGAFRGPIRWREDGDGDDLVVTAIAHMADTGEEVTAEASMAMAKAEGWTKNAKYKSMPGVMLRYRSATFLIRQYCPEVMFGYRAADELEDMAAAEARDVTPVAEDRSTAPAASAASEVRAPTAQADAVVEDAVTVEDADAEPDRGTQAAEKTGAEPAETKQAAAGVDPKPAGQATPQEEAKPEAATKPAESKPRPERKRTGTRGKAQTGMTELKAPDGIERPVPVVRMMQSIVGQLPLQHTVEDVEDLMTAYDGSLDDIGEHDPAAREWVEAKVEERIEELGGRDEDDGD